MKQFKNLNAQLPEENCLMIVDALNLAFNNLEA